MMNSRNSQILFPILCCILGFLILGGCAPAEGDGQVAFRLADEIGEFDVSAGTAESNRGTASFHGAAGSTSGSMRLDSESITIRPDESGTVTANTVTVSIRLSSASAVETVCDLGEPYGPFEVSFGPDSVVDSISPMEVDLSNSVLAILRSGFFGFCVEVTAPFDGSVQIGRLLFEFESQ